MLAALVNVAGEERNAQRAEELWQRQGDFGTDVCIHMIFYIHIIYIYINRIVYIINIIIDMLHVYKYDINVFKKKVQD